MGRKTDTQKLYEQDKTFARVVDSMAAYTAHEGGQSIKEIAKQAGKSETTIRRYIKDVRIGLS